MEAFYVPADWQLCWSLSPSGQVIFDTGRSFGIAYQLEDIDLLGWRRPLQAPATIKTELFSGPEKNQNRKTVFLVDRYENRENFKDV